MSEESESWDSRHAIAHHKHETPRPRTKISTQKFTICRLRNLSYMVLGEPNFLIFPTFVGGFLRKGPQGLFWPMLGLYFIYGPFLVFFWGSFQIFWSLNIIGGDHGPILFFVVFHFLGHFGPFCQFWAVFHFGAFLYFWVVRGGHRGGQRS